MGREILSSARVRALVLAGRVAPDPRYHGFEHGMRFDQLRALPAFCQRVEADRRPEHPEGYVA